MTQDNPLNRLPGGLDLPAVAGWVFMAAGAAMLVGGIVLVFDDPGGFALIAFGLVFVGAGWLARRLFATPPGKKSVQVGGYAAGVRRLGGQPAVRRQATMIHVDEDAGEAEIATATRDWLIEQWQQRPDWAAGRIVSEDARSGTLVYWGAGLWLVFALGALGAALIWGDIAWLVAAGAAVMAAIFVVMAARAWLRRRKFGQAVFVMPQAPAMLGGRLEGEVETGLAKSTVLPEGFRLRLRCVHRWEETRGTGSDRRTHHRLDVLWEQEARTPGRVSARSSGYLAPVGFELPADRPATTLGGGREGIAWELTVSASLPGVDYATTFDVPVLDREQADLLAPS